MQLELTKMMLMVLVVQEVLLLLQVELEAQEALLDLMEFGLLT